MYMKPKHTKFDDDNQYEGDFKNKKRHGYGKLTFGDGSIYIGEFKDDKMCGYGRFKRKDGNHFVGEFKNGIIIRGTIFYTHGNTRYEGEFNECGMRHGYGKFWFADGRTYEGDFRHGRMSGYGKITRKNNNDRTYYGVFVDGVLLREGKNFENLRFLYKYLRLHL